MSVGFCPVCNGPMTPMISSWFCPRDCDRKQPEVAINRTNPCLEVYNQAVGLPAYIPKTLRTVPTRYGVGLVVTDYRDIPQTFQWAKWWRVGATETDESYYVWWKYSFVSGGQSGLTANNRGNVWDPLTDKISGVYQHLVQGAIYVV